MSWFELSHRGVIAVRGQDKRSFLQGLLTQDLNKLAPQKALYAALLTPQGKFLFDLFLSEKDDVFYLEGERERLSDLIRRLSLFKLRSDVVLELVEGLRVFVSFEQETLANAELLFLDPRLKEMGMRAYVHSDALPLEQGRIEGYHLARLQLGVPEGSMDMPIEKAIPLECGLDELGAIDWQKGCYMGQELTARTRYRGLVRKRLIPVNALDDFQERHKEAPILQGDQEVGQIFSFQKNWALAKVRLEVLERDVPLICGGLNLTPHPPFWMKRDEQI